MISGGELTNGVVKLPSDITGYWNFNSSLSHLKKWKEGSFNPLSYKREGEKGCLVLTLFWTPMTIAVRDESYRTHTWCPPEVSQLVYLGIFSRLHEVRSVTWHHCYKSMGKYKKLLFWRREWSKTISRTWYRDFMHSLQSPMLHFCIVNLAWRHLWRH